jgi:hypothetical protein
MVRECAVLAVELAIEHRYNEATRHAKRARHPSGRKSSYFGASW